MVEEERKFVGMLWVFLRESILDCDGFLLDLFRLMSFTLLQNHRNIQILHP